MLVKGKAKGNMAAFTPVGCTEYPTICLSPQRWGTSACYLLNFIEQPELISLFETAHSAKDLLMRLSVIAGKEMIPHETILFFDEVQEFKDIVTRIKFLVQEESFQYIMSGFLLGIELHNLRSAPVGFLRILDMFPLTFQEFILNLGIQETTIQHLQEAFMKRTPVDSFIHDKMMEVFYLYQIIGGMPEAVSIYLETNNIQRVGEVHDKIISLYRQDFTKYEDRYALRIKEIYDVMASQLDAKNKRFKINSIKKCPDGHVI